MHFSHPIKLTVAAMLGFLFVAASLPLHLAGQGTVADPPSFVWTLHPVTENNSEAYYSGVMEVGEAAFLIDGETLTTRAYRQAGGSFSIPGPTITMAPGNKYVLRLHNTLPFEPLSPLHNVFKDPNVSNIHTHGLHISGESPGDDVTRSFEGGFGGDFVWDIPADHMGGTHWYHAHHHGSTYLQVAGGLFGMLIIDDSADGIPANVAAMTEKQIVLGFLDTDAAGTGGDTIMSGTLDPTWTVNGVVGGTINAQRDTWQHWRVLVADTADPRTQIVEFGPECEVVLLARDGIWRTSAPRMLNSDNTIRLTGASRADFAVRVSGNSQLKIDALFNSSGPDLVANITADGTPDPTVHPFDTDGVSMWSALRPEYLRDLRDENNVDQETISLAIEPGPIYTLNGAQYNKNVPNFTKSIKTESLQQWNLSNAGNHPFHLHIYPMQAQSSSTLNGFEEGEFYDVVAANINVRFDMSPSPFEGRTIFHCHVLQHEDQGMMGWMDVLGGTPPPTFPLDGDIPEPYSEYYSLAGTVLGDVNLDGVVNLLDVAPFVDRISTGTFQAEADINQDGAVNLLDVDPFIALLSGG